MTTGRWNRSSEIPRLEQIGFDVFLSRGSNTVNGNNVETSGIITLSRSDIGGQMRKIGVAIAVSVLCCLSGFAQNNRSAVSLTGSDTASCTVPDPCRTFSTAMSKTNAGGEIVVLSTAGYGPFSVNKSVSIISPPAYHAAMAPTTGAAITIDTPNV